MISVGYTKPFAMANIVAILTNIFLGRYVMIDLQMPIYGLPVCWFFNELIIFFIIMFWWFVMIDANLKQKVNWKIFNDEILSFVKES